MKRIFQILILISSLTCYSQSNSNSIDLIGTWKFHVGYFDCTLILNADSTYKYLIVGDLNNSKTEGIWTQKNKKLILSSYKQKASETSIKSEYCDSIKGVKFVIKNDSGEPISMPQIKIKNSQTEFDTLIENNSGVFDFKDFNNILEFKISFVGLKDAIWIGKMNRNYFEIYMTPEHDDYIYQINEIWKIKGDRLYSPTSKKEHRLLGRRGKIDYYLKEKTNSNNVYKK